MATSDPSEHIASTNAPPSERVEHFERDMEALQTLVTSLGQAPLNLSDTLSTYQKALALSQRCQAALDDAQAWVTQWEATHQDDPDHNVT